MYVLITFIHHILAITLSKAVTFSHVSGEPVSHIPFTKVENGSKLGGIAENLAQFHGHCLSKYGLSSIHMCL